MKPTQLNKHLFWGIRDEARLCIVHFRCRTHLTLHAQYSTQIIYANISSDYLPMSCYGGYKTIHIFHPTIAQEQGWIVLMANLESHK